MGHAEAVDQAAANVRRLGHHEKLLIKTDGEPALVDLRRGVSSKLGVQSVPERTPVGEPQSNGSVECGVRQFKGLLRTLLLALEARIGALIPATHPITLWLVEHTTELLAKHLVGRDGKSPVERLLGKKCRVEAFEIGEQV